MDNPGNFKSEGDDESRDTIPRKKFKKEKQKSIFDPDTRAIVGRCVFHKDKLTVSKRTNEKKR